MNAYLFTAVTTRSQIRTVTDRYGTANTIQSWDACVNTIVGGDNPDDAQNRFEAWLSRQPEGENPVDVRIRKIAAAQFVNQLFTESGSAPFNWPEIQEQVRAQLDSTAVDDFEQGYWVEVDQVVRPENLSLSAGTLQSDVPEDIRSGLNWSSEKKFFFVLSVLSPLAPPVETLDEPETDPPDSDGTSDENSEVPAPMGLGELYATYPQALDKDAAALIQARNSVVAAWLWRRYAADTPLAANAIRIDPWCDAIGLDDK